MMGPSDGGTRSSAVPGIEHSPSCSRLTLGHVHCLT